MQRRRRPPPEHVTVPVKANRILHLVLVVMALLLIRLWYLTVVQHDQRVETARRPTRRVVIEPARRATIRDRFNLPLAINQIQYNAAVDYVGIREIKSIEWEVQPDGKRIKRQRRKEYIRELANLLAAELDLEPDRVTDLIHAKASVYDHLPLVIKRDINEQQYYRLKMLEHNWPGLVAQRVPFRHYPRERLAGDVIGYMGAISRAEYDAILAERRALQEFLQGLEVGTDAPIPAGVASAAEAKQRLHDLEEKAYTLNDFVGKTGIEASFEEDLRGFHGKHFFYADSRGNYLRELPGGYEPTPGKRLLLTLSAELQEHAEQLLIQSDSARAPRVHKPDAGDFGAAHSKQRWIKGGAIVAIDPITGELLAMASCPRLNPNDFIPSGRSVTDREKRSQIRHWFESETYLGELWDGQRPLERERFDKQDGVIEEQKWLTWQAYLETVLDQNSDLYNSMQRLTSVQQVVALQRGVNALLSMTEDSDLCYLLNRLYETDGHSEQPCRIPGRRKENMEAQLRSRANEVAALKTSLQPFLGGLKHTYDKLLLIDLTRLLIHDEQVPDDLLQHIGTQSLSDYNQHRQTFLAIQNSVYDEAKQRFHLEVFPNWRAQFETDFLKACRAEEKRLARHNKPYIDHLDAKEQELFARDWEAERWKLVLAGIGSSSLEAHASLRALLQKLGPQHALAYIKSFRSFSELNQTLHGHYRGLRRKGDVQLERHLAAAFYPISGYGFGRSWAYRQAAVQGSVFKLVTAYEALIQRYHALIAAGRSLTDLNPLDIIDQAHRKGKSWYVGYTLDNESIPQMYKGGRIPRSLSRNIGRIDIVRALETSSNPYFILLASDHMDTPSSLARAAKRFGYGALTGIELPGEIAGNVPDDLEENRNGLYSFAIGQHSLVVTPLQTALMLSSIANGGLILKPQIVRLVAGAEVTTLSPHARWQVEYPTEIRQLILEGMSRVSKYCLPADAVELKESCCSKTSTGESTERVSLERLTGTLTYNHVWFGTICYDKSQADSFIVRDARGKPELVVVVYLRFGGVGKDAAALAAQVATKWREIKKRDKT